MRQTAMSQSRARLTQAERTAISDRRMFESAMTLISKQGASRTSLREICERAGYSRGLANYRFGSKDAFLQQLLLHFNHEWTKELESHVVSKAGLAAFDAAVDALESFLLDHSEYMRGGYLIWYESIGGNNEVRSRLQYNHDTYRRETARWISDGQQGGEVRPDVDPEQFAMLYCSVVFGTIFQWLANPEAVDLAAFFSHWRVQARRLLT